MKKVFPYLVTAKRSFNGFKGSSSKHNISNGKRLTSSIFKTSECGLAKLATGPHRLQAKFFACNLSILLSADV